MSERSSRAARTALAITVPTLALLGWALWRGSPAKSVEASGSICKLGADSVPHGMLQARALADARERESECDGHAMECRFTVWAAPSGAGVEVDVDLARVNFEKRLCGRSTDSIRSFHYAADGHLESVEHPHP